MPNQLIKTNKFLRIFPAGWLVWSAIQVVIMQYFGFTLLISVTDSIVFNLLLAGSCIFIAFVMQFYLPQKEKYWYVVAVSFVASAIVTIISNLILHQFFFSEEIYHNFLTAAWPVRGSIAFLISGCMALISIVFYTVEEQQELEQRKHAAEQLSKEAELFNLRQQLQPHFLFNSLNSISALAGSKPEEARNMIQQLSDFLRGTIRKDSNQMITLEDELKHLQLYLDIEKVRFGHRLMTETHCSEEVCKLKIPSLLLQPVVENAIKFGLYDTLEEVKITITGSFENNMLVVTIANPFDKTSVPAGKQAGTGFGLNSIQRRLFLLFSRNDLLITNATDTIFTTTIKIPQS